MWKLSKTVWVESTLCVFCLDLVRLKTSNFNILIELDENKRDLNLSIAFYSLCAVYMNLALLLLLVVFFGCCSFSRSFFFEKYNLNIESSRWRQLHQETNERTERSIDWYGSKIIQVWELIDRTCFWNQTSHKLRFDQVCMCVCTWVCAYFTGIKLTTQINKSGIYRQRWRCRCRQCAIIWRYIAFT